MSDKVETLETHVYLDDMRKPPFGWKLVKNYDECIAALQTGKVEYLSLDHDLGEEHYENYYATTGYVTTNHIPYDEFKEKTGYDVAKWLVENPEIFGKLKVITLHSANPVGRNNMRSLINAHKPESVKVYG